MAIDSNRVIKARVFVSVIVVVLCLFSIAVLFLRDINASNWYEELLTQYFPVLVIPAACIYLLILAFRVHRLEDRVAVASAFDPLTHTLKNVSLVEKAKRIYEQTDLAEAPISILCMELDRISAIEQEYGETAARAVLREFGGTVIGATREDDLVGRYEDTMFVAIIMNTGQQYAPQVVQRFQELAHADVLLVEDAEVRYSICVGCSSSDSTEPAPEFDQLMAQARSALSSAKQEGPATVVHYSGS